MSVIYEFCSNVNVCNDWHCWKQLFLIVITSFGITIDVFPIFLNAFCSYTLILGKLLIITLEHSRKQSCPILVMLLKSNYPLKLVHCLNTEWYNVVQELGIFILYKEESFQKELAPNEVIVLGSVTDVNSEQLSKQLFGILVIEPKLEILCTFVFANEYWPIVVSNGRLSVEITKL